MAVELRRALLLFAIVLGVAAVVAALASPSPQRSQSTTATPPPADPEPPAGGRSATTVRIDGRGAPVRKTLAIERATTVVVSVDEPGQVELRALGLTESAEPRDPAVFEILPTRRARFEVLFTPSGGVRPRALGVLVSRRAE